MMMTSTSVSDLVMKRVRASGRGSVFTPRDFLELATRAAVDQALSGLAKTDHLRRRPRGLYDFPKLHPKLGALTPTADDLAQALARETGSHLQIDGARAANALGLSTPVAAQSSWLTGGPSRRVVLGKRVIDLRHASPKHLIAPVARQELWLKRSAMWELPALQMCCRRPSGTSRTATRRYSPKVLPKRQPGCVPP